MGYYSHVYICMKQSDYADMRDAIYELADPNLKRDIWYLLNAVDTIYDPYYNAPEFKGQFISMEWYDIKWYWDSPEMAYIENYVKNLPVYHFIRLGEEQDDTENESECNNYNDGSDYVNNRYVARKIEPYSYVQEMNGEVPF